MNIFRTATKQALREIIEESAIDGRFGFILGEDGIEKATERIVDLFEMTLELRSRVGLTTGSAGSGMGGESQAKQKTNQNVNQRVNQNTGQNTARENQMPNEAYGSQSRKSSLPTTRNAAEIYDVNASTPQQLRGAYEPRAGLSPAMDLKLPRKRIELSSTEKERLGR